MKFTLGWLKEHLDTKASLEEITTRLNADAEQIQCVVSKNLIPNSVTFGQTQQPNLWDYADNVDTLAFLNSLK